MGCCGQMTRAEKVKSIYTGWRNVIWKDKETEEESMRRVEICADCKHNKNNFCLQCGCWIPAKARSMVERCPINKWDDG